VGEDRLRGDQPQTDPATDKLAVSEAAEMLGISPDAVRSRIKRGTLPHVRESGRVFVTLGAADRLTDQSQSASDVLTSELRDRLRYVEGQLEAERLAHAEARRLLMAALERIPPQLEASEAPEAPESPETTADTPSSATAPPEPQEGAQRPWWRRMFGG
jgi:hypothetical protein